MPGATDNEVMDRGDNFTPTAADRAEAADRTNADIIAASKTVVDSNEVVEKDDTASKSASDKADDKVEDTKDEDQPARDDKGRFGIPKARFDEAVQKEREKAELAQRQVVELQKQLQTVDRSAKVVDLEAQILELRKADRKAIMDGDEDKSIELAGQIDRLNRQIMVAESQSISAQAAEEAREGIRTDAAIDRLEEIYPVLKEGSETFDQITVNQVLSYQTFLMQTERMSRSQALIKAANDIMVRQLPAAKADEEKPSGGLKDAKGAERTTAQKQKNIDAALKTPPDTRDVGLDTDKVGMKDGLPTPMNIEDLKAIPEATLKRMRGDMI